MRSWVDLIIKIVMLALIVVAGYIIYKQQVTLSNVEKSLTELKAEVNQSNLQIGRAEVLIDQNGALLEQMSRSIPADIVADMEDHRAVIIEIGRATVVNDSKGGGSVVLRKTLPTPHSPVREAASPIPEAIAERPVGDCDFGFDFKDWRLKVKFDKPCDKHLGQLTYELNQKFSLLLVEGEAPNEAAPSYIKVWELDEKGQKMEPPLTVTDFIVVKKKANLPRFFSFNPHLDVGAGYRNSFKEFEPVPFGEIGLSLMSYGETRDDSSWRFLRVGAALAEDGPGGVVCPAVYNVGKPLPLVSNVWINPCYQYTGEHGASLSLGAVF